VKAAAIIALAGCTSYAHLSLHNAPGTTNLAAPLPRENGDPVRFESATDPGSTYFDIIAAPFITGGTGHRAGPGGAVETGIEFQLEPRHDGPELLEAATLGITAGIAVAQWSDGPVRLPGPIFAELSYRFVGGVIPMGVGLGPVLYAGDHDLGAQLTYRLFGGVFRFRYVANGGFEFTGGYEIPVPFLFGGSK